MPMPEQPLPSGAVLCRNWLSRADQQALLLQLSDILERAPLYVPRMPKTGREMSVRMTNCGRLGWVTDREGGYRYQAHHPETGRPWPEIPAVLLELWRQVGCYPAPPEACLVNYYGAQARMGSHRDADEADKAAPVVSLSLGDDAVFHVGGTQRAGAKVRVTLHSGDVFVLAGPSRLAYHGIDRVLAGTSDLLPDGGRINLTLRRVTMP